MVSDHIRDDGILQYDSLCDSCNAKGVIGGRLQLSAASENRWPEWSRPPVERHLFE